MSYLLTSLAYSLPELLGVGIAFALVLTNALPGAGRRLGLIGLGVILAADVLGLMVSVLQALWLQSGPLDSSTALSVVSAVHMLLNVLSLGGLLTVVWGLCRATRTPPTG